MKKHGQPSISVSAFLEEAAQWNKPHSSVPSTAIFVSLLSQTQHDRYFQSATVTID